MASLFTWRSRKRIQTLVSIGVSLALLTLIAGTFNTYRHVKTLVAANRDVAECHRTLEQLQQITAMLNECLSASRGYVLAERRDYLQTYEDTKLRIAPVIASMAQREADEDDVSSNILQLRGLIHFRLLLQDELILTRDEKGFQAASNLFQQPRSQLVSEQITIVSGRIESLENHELARNQSAANRIEHETVRNIMVAGIPALLLLFISGLVIKRDFARRERAEQTVADAEARFRALLQNSSDIVVVIDPAGLIEYVTPAVENILGYSREDVLLQNFLRYLHPDDIALGLESFQRTAATPGPAVPLQLRLRHQRGNFVDMEIMGNNLLHDPNVRGVIVNARDITVRKHLLNRLELNYSVTRVLGAANSLLDAAPNILDALCAAGGYRLAELWTIDENRRTSTCVDSWRENGAEPLEPPGAEYPLSRGGLVSRVYTAKEMVRIHHLPDDPVFASRDRASALGLNGAVGIPVSFEGSVSAVICLYGRQTDSLDDELASVFKRIGEEFGAFIARKGAEQTQLRLTTILEATPDFVAIADPAGLVQYVNRAARSQLGWEIGPHLQLRSLMPQWACEQFDSKALPAALRDGYWTGESVLISSSGAEVPISQVILSHRSTDGELEFLSTVMHDISDRKAVENMKDDFISMVSHELRTPLTSIRAALGLLASGQLAHDDVMAKRMLELANINTVRLVRLVNDILEIERLDAGRLVMQKRSVDAAQLILSAASSMHSACHGAGISLVVQPGHAIIEADPDRILQTLTNLLGNALKFSPAGSSIRIISRVDGDRVLFSVSDHGRGVPKGKQDLIFERFQQVDASDSRIESGTGLGLAICRSIVRAHGGEIWVESQQGLGSTFIFFVPLALKEHNSPSTKEKADEASAGH